MTIQKVIEDQGFDFGFFVLLEFLRVTFLLGSGCSVAFGIDIGGEQDVLAVWRPEFATGFRSNGGQFVHASDASNTAIEVCDPYLRSAFLCRNKRETFAVRRPARAVAVLIGDENALARVDGRDARRSIGGVGCRKRHDPDMRSFLVRREIDIDRAEQHPLAVGRGHGLGHALERHHVFEGEWMLGLREAGDYRKHSKEQDEYTAHTFLREQTE